MSELTEVNLIQNPEFTRFYSSANSILTEYKKNKNSLQKKNFKSGATQRGLDWDIYIINNGGVWDNNSTFLPTLRNTIQAFDEDIPGTILFVGISDYGVNDFDQWHTEDYGEFAEYMTRYQYVLQATEHHKMQIRQVGDNNSINLIEIPYEQGTISKSIISHNLEKNVVNVDPDGIRRITVIIDVYSEDHIPEEYRTSMSSSEIREKILPYQTEIREWTFGDD
jgi:hypothetical protein